MFQPYDHVLVRNYDYEEWLATFYSHTKEMYGGVFHISCSGGEWRQCIPYDSSLVGTNEYFGETEFDLIAANRNLQKRVRELEDNIEMLTHEAACLIGSMPTLDCRICDYSAWCGRDETQVDPDFYMCKEAIFNFCKLDSKEA